MHIRTAAVMCFCLCAASASYAFETDYLYMKSSIYGGFAAAAIKDNNSGPGADAGSGYGLNLEKINLVQAAGLSVMPLFKSDFAGIIAPYIKIEYYSASNVNAIEYPGGGIIEKTSPVLMVYYTGFGLRKYFDGWGGLIPFIAADAGINIAVNNYVEKLYYDNTGRLSSATVIDLNGCFAGASISTGCEFDLLNFAGVEAAIGYSSAGGNLDSYYRSTDQGINGKKGYFKTDLSGIFAKAGITFNFLQGQAAGKNPEPVLETENKVVAAAAVAESTKVSVSEAAIVTATAMITITAATAEKPVLEPTKVDPSPTATSVPGATMTPQAVKKNILQKNPGTIKKDSIATEALPAPAPEKQSGDLEASGDLEFKKKDFAGAAGYYVNALKYRNDALLNKKAGNSYYYSGNKTEAEKYYEQSLKLDPGDSKLKEFLDLIK